MKLTKGIVLMVTGICLMLFSTASVIRGISQLMDGNLVSGAVWVAGGMTFFLLGIRLGDKGSRL